MKQRATFSLLLITTFMLGGWANSLEPDPKDAWANSDRRVGTVPELGNQEVTLVYGSKGGR